MVSNHDLTKICFLSNLLTVKKAVEYYTTKGPQNCDYGDGDDDWTMIHNLLNLKVFSYWSFMHWPEMTSNIDFISKNFAYEAQQ